MEKSIKKIPQNVLQILSAKDRNDDQIEKLLDYFETLEDFHNYMKNIPKSCLKQLGKHSKLEIFQPNSIVFTKGSPSDKLYVILIGHLNIFDTLDDGTYKFIASLSRGKMIGEKSLMRSQPRNISAMARDNLILLSIDGEVFKSEMNYNTSIELEEKIKFFDFYIPELKKYSIGIKEKIARVFDVLRLNKKEILIEEGNFGDSLFYISDGECMLSRGVPPSKTNIMSLGIGCSIADECVLLGRKTEFTVCVNSESALVYKAKRADFLPLLPEDVMLNLVQTSKVKYFGRKNILKHSKQYPKLQFSIEKKKFPLASLAAQTSISKIINRNSRRTLDINRSALTFKHKSKLDQLRDFSIDSFHRPSLPNNLSGSISDRWRINPFHNNNKSNMA
ncbi:unnamed protein product [Blepharisma stoltei]|uniref:Cyclic nucleotide-binding domain-containing protein n=1 Tax=Blepharisma stoltei TaxID=1481888 RepID=A0AAU9ICZ9_9CILI|nr:unnamed protein product [Blepharisma stoltei]